MYVGVRYKALFWTSLDLAVGCPGGEVQIGHCTGGLGRIQMCIENHVSNLLCCDHHECCLCLC